MRVLVAVRVVVGAHEGRVGRAGLWTVWTFTIIGWTERVWLVGAGSRQNTCAPTDGVSWTFTARLTRTVFAHDRLYDCDY